MHVSHKSKKNLININSKSKSKSKSTKKYSKSHKRNKKIMRGCGPVFSIMTDNIENTKIRHEIKAKYPLFNEEEINSEILPTKEKRNDKKLRDQKRIEQNFNVFDSTTINNNNESKESKENIKSPIDFVKIFSKKTTSGFGVNVNQIEREKLKLILKDIYKNNIIRSFLGRGAHKLVFLSTDDKIFKVQIASRKELGMLIKAPLYMLKHDTCNSPLDITVYCNNEKNCEIKDIKIINCTNLDRYCIITWYEELAYKIGESSYNEKETIEAIKFARKTIPQLTKDKFWDLGYDNFGLFKQPPYYRWTDLQPTYDMPKNDNCLY